VLLKTGNVNSGGTNGRVYLGIGGVEFRMNESGNVYEE